MASKASSPGDIVRRDEADGDVVADDVFENARDGGVQAVVEPIAGVWVRDGDVVGLAFDAGYPGVEEPGSVKGGMIHFEAEAVEGGAPDLVG